MSYWEERQTAMYKAGEMKVNQYFTKLEKAFNQTRRELQKTVESFCWRYAEENGLTFEAAQKQLDKAEIGELKDFIEKAMENIGKYNQEVNNMSIKYRMTAYQALEAQVDAILRQLYAIDYEAEAELTMQEVYGDAYYRTWYNIDQYRGFHSTFAPVDASAVETLLEYPFNGANFSSRLWKQKDHLQTVLMESLTTMMIQGVPPQNLAGDLAKKMQTKKFEAYRLLHTESSFLISEATHAGYREDGVEKYEILATLDSKTCGICGNLDGEIFPVEEAVTGKNMPPFHCFCRCTDVPHYDDDDLSDQTRAARDPETGKTYEVAADMTWKEWKAQYVEEAPVKRNGQKLANKITDYKVAKTVEELPADYKSEIYGIIESSPDTIRKFTKKHINSVRFKNIRNIGTAYSSSEGIRLNWKEDRDNPLGPYEATFHEIGHALDRAVGRLSSRTPEFAKLLKSDFDALVKAYQTEYNVNIRVAYEQIGLKIQDDKYYAISDLFGGMTGNQCVGQWMHDAPGYWNSPNRLEREAFAHFYSACIRKSDEVEVIRSVFPNAYREFLKLLEEQ